MTHATIRPATAADLGAVTRLRWDWTVEKIEMPGTSRTEFEAGFVGWARRHSASHRCVVAVIDDVVVGMAWLAVVSRVPSARSLERASGDVQCVYVVPDHRNHGIGGRLVADVLRQADDLGLERVTVHSSDRAIPTYRRAGFATSPRFMLRIADA
jgi:GNAT superfamily N-acetyltransferase